jgi:uncharacterized protein
MKLHPSTGATLTTVTAYGAGWTEVNGVRHTGALLLMPERPATAWSAGSFDALTPADFEGLLALEPELVLLGTGERQRFPHPSLTRALIAARVGVEAMDTRAACRTYNLLMTEGRKVLAALLPA